MDLMTENLAARLGALLGGMREGRRPKKGSQFHWLEAKIQDELLE